MVQEIDNARRILLAVDGAAGVDRRVAEDRPMAVMVTMTDEWVEQIDRLARICKNLGCVEITTPTDAVRFIRGWNDHRPCAVNFPRLTVEPGAGVRISARTEPSGALIESGLLGFDEIAGLEYHAWREEPWMVFAESSSGTVIFDGRDGAVQQVWADGEDTALHRIERFDVAEFEATYGTPPGCAEHATDIDILDIGLWRRAPDRYVPPDHDWRRLMAADEPAPTM